MIIGKSAARSAHASVQENTVIGALSAYNISNGERNTTLGYNSAYEIESGSNNVSIGAYSLQQNTDGSENVAIGNMALQNPFEPNSFEQYRNTAIGHKAAWNIAGDGNIAVGYEAGNNMDAGDDNIYIGNLSGTKTTGGTQIGGDNIFIGNNTSYAPAIGSTMIENAVAIGNDVVIPNSNIFVIGNELNSANRSIDMNGETSIKHNAFVGEKLGVNTASIPTDYHLAVNGAIIAEEIRVELNNNWPDYVFDTTYQLKSIPELTDFIEKNNHLPGMPSADKINDEGYHLGEIQRKMMEKIEELTLYIIQLHDSNELLKEEIQKLK